jgi:16S rRNA (guanine(966)-N(2))-methyltransferase RsmD
MRIVAGRFRGARMEAPKGLLTRPTSDRVRQALFNVLEHGAPRFEFEGARVLDLFAGSGALGLEALSRGARYAVFIEDDAAARGAIRRNVEALGLARFSPSISSSAIHPTVKVSGNRRSLQRLTGGGRIKARSPCWKSAPIPRSSGPRRS